MTTIKRFKRWLARSWAGFLVPLYYAQEDFRMGTLYLYVSRWGAKSWEVYYFGPNTSSGDFDRMMKPHAFGTATWYERLQALCGDPTVCRRVGVCGSWQEARRAVDKYFSPDEIEKRNRGLA